MLPSHCPICETNSISVVYAAAQDYITEETFQVQRCDRCGIVFTTPKPDDLGPFYPARYRRYSPLALKILEFLYGIRAKKWSKLFGIPGIVFEMGCGDGIMLNTLRRQGWKVVGNERTAAAAAFACHNLKIPIFVGGIDSLTHRPFADLIILFQVLEHLEDPVGTLAQLHQRLRPNGKLVIGVPNFNGWQSKFGGEKWFHLDVPRHLFHFSLPSLEFCLKESGFEIIQVSYVSFEHDPYGWVQSTLNRMCGKHNYLTKLLMGLVRADSSFISHITLAFLVGLISLPISIVSWSFKQGAIMEVVARKANV